MHNHLVEPGVEGRKITSQQCTIIFFCGGVVAMKVIGIAIVPSSLCLRRRRRRQCIVVLLCGGFVGWRWRQLLSSPSFCVWKEEDNNVSSSFFMEVLHQWRWWQLLLSPFSLCLKRKRQRHIVVIFFCGGVTGKKATTICCRCFLCCVWKEKDDNNAPLSSFVEVLQRWRWQ